MSGFKAGLGNLAADAAAGIGNGYQDILLQDSPIFRDRGLETSADPWPGAQASDQPWAGMNGETLGPEQETSRDPGDFMALESRTTIDADYTEIPEPPQIEHQPDIDGPDIDR